MEVTTEHLEVPCLVGELHLLQQTVAVFLISGTIEELTDLQASNGCSGMVVNL